MNKKMATFFIAILVAFGIGGVLPGLLGSYLMRLVIFSLIYSLLALSFNLTLGFRGELSLGHQTFFGIGAYVAAILSRAYGLPLLALLPLASIGAAIGALAIGPIALRMRGPYFAIVTLSVGVIAEILAVNLVDLTNGPMGISNIGTSANSMFGWSVPLRPVVGYYEILVLLVVLGSAVTFGLRESRFGRAWRALRDHEDLAAAIGISAFPLDLLALVISGGMAGIAGAVYAFYTTVVAPDDVFSFSVVVMMLVSVVLGGRGTILGPIIGAFIFTFVPEYLRIASEWRLPIFGIVLVFLVIMAPQGLMVLTSRTSHRLGKHVRLAFARLNS